jgi:hypothetical protein
MDYDKFLHKAETVTPLGDPMECDACGSETPCIKNERPPESPKTESVAYLCWFCYCTHASNAYWYPDLYVHADVLHHINYVANMLWQALKR